MSKNILPTVDNIVAIASGKGGVGKSTVTANLAVSLVKQGFKVGLLDADIFGPSMPKMFDVEDEKPKIEKVGDKDLIVPVEKYGVKIISIGFFVDKENAIIWRGPMAAKSLEQLIKQSHWGELDYLLIDLPPGTSDIHLSLVQTLPVTGVIIVTTPQNVAIADAIKGIGMFRDENINVPILGLVENMSWFTPEELPNNKYYIFGKDGVKTLAEKFYVPVLGQIPIVQNIREDGDNGKPTALDENSIIGKAFKKLTVKIDEQVGIRNFIVDKAKVYKTTK